MSPSSWSGLRRRSTVPAYERSGSRRTSARSSTSPARSPWSERLPEGDERSRTEAELQLQLGVALFALRGLGAPEVERAYTRATELMMASAPAAEQFPAQFGLSIYYGHRGDFDRSMRLVERLTELASEGDDSMRLQALHARWMNSLFGGRIDDAVAAADEGRAIYRPEAHHSLSFLYGNHDPGVCALALQALAFALRGESVRAVTQMHEAIALGEALGHAATLAQPLTQLRGLFRSTATRRRHCANRSGRSALEGEVVHPQFFGIAHAMRGWALSRARAGRGGRRRAREGARGRAPGQRHLGGHDRRAPRRGPPAPRSTRKQPETCSTRCGRSPQSMPAYFYEPELLRVEAEWLRLAGREEDASRLLLRAIPPRGSTGRGLSQFALRSHSRVCPRPSTRPI